VATALGAADPPIGRAGRLRRPLTTLGAVGVAGLALVLRDPHHHTWVLCPFKALSGWDCPLCGGLRAVNDLGHGAVGAAAHSNLLFVGSLPLLLLGWLLWVRSALTGRVPRPRRGAVRLAAATYLAVAVAFTVLRNTPWGSAFHVA
jgi:hypothetical protein